ncbi:MAG TPA: crosslink repair DNA glycosylase YcaQ family protein, partial [Candidatus Sulfotelmatobacter sp.]|nr:crosslink repair DNA glycosylase YcaQ family protein [Candidatus Sulfotelmatobacter sp.]
PVAHLLPNFDEYTVAYRDRAAILHPDRAFDPTLFSFGSVLANVVTIGGLVVGAWRRTAAGKDLRVEVRPLGRVSPVEASLVEGAGERLSRYLGRPVDLRWL